MVGGLPSWAGAVAGDPMPYGEFDPMVLTKLTSR